VAGLPFTPCARVEKIDYRSFRSSLVGLSFFIATSTSAIPAAIWSVSGTSDFPPLPAALDSRAMQRCLLHRRLNTSQKGNCVATSNSEQTVSILGYILWMPFIFL
jgi:hypothetical protein